MVVKNKQVATPLNVPRTRRVQDIAVMTSMIGGVSCPVAVVPLLREDAVSGRVQINVEMLETAELLANDVTLRALAFLVPNLALERFEGSRDQFERSYMGQPKVDGGAVVPFFELASYGTHGANAVYKALGLHGQPTDQVNQAYLEGYNAIYNWRAENRAQDITKRSRLDATLAPAFWQHTQFDPLVAEVDLAIMDGEVGLNVAAGALPIRYNGGNFAPAQNIGFTSGVTYQAAGVTVKMARGDDDVSVTTAGQRWSNAGLVAKEGVQGQNRPSVGVLLDAMYAEMIDNGITVSLANIELARKTQAFATLREGYSGIDDDYIIDMLMNGIRVPDQMLRTPLLLADKVTRFRQAKRYATDAANLAASATSGAASLSLNFRTPAMNTGGFVMIIVEALPVQMFERRRDPFFTVTNTRDANELVDLPAYLRDELDPEKVDLVTNGQIDSAHSTPNGTFAFAPKNWKWASFGPRAGGKFLRPTTDPTTDTVRRRFWAVEKANPVLGEDFYVAKNLQQKPFLDPAIDNFEIGVGGQAVIVGNTVFGPRLVELVDDESQYDKVMEKADTTSVVP